MAPGNPQVWVFKLHAARTCFKFLCGPIMHEEPMPGEIQVNVGTSLARDSQKHFFVSIGQRRYLFTEKLIKHLQPEWPSTNDK